MVKLTKHPIPFILVKSKNIAIEHTTDLGQFGARFMVLGGRRVPAG